MFRHIQPFLLVVQRRHASLLPHRQLQFHNSYETGMAQKLTRIRRSCMAFWGIFCGIGKISWVPRSRGKWNCVSSACCLRLRSGFRRSTWLPDSVLNSMVVRFGGGEHDETDTAIASAKARQERSPFPQFAWKLKERRPSK